MKTYDPDTARRRLIFSAEVVTALMNRPFNLFLEWKLEQIGRAIAVDRLAYLRSDDLKKTNLGNLYLASGYGHRLPFVGSRNIKISPDQFAKLRAGGWIWTPTADIGWDALFSFRSNGHLGVIAIDDTSSERVFTEADQEFLINAASWFGICYDAKYEIEAEKNRAKTDPLTKLPNQRACSHRLQKTVEGIELKEIPHACITVIDIDNFKAVNDLHGHAFGDTVLKKLSEIFKNNPETFAGRYGGEEFIVISYANLEQSVGIIQDFLDQFKSSNLICSTAAKPYSGSFSAGTFEIKPERLRHEDTKKDADLCFQEADKLMYRAKNEGKSQICSA
ncbi:MAG: GGDEF domain-containing protein [Patescibacteria group bacterium]|nr:GGDEF domain-containing protein [Patescibacteria group bacterium]